MAGRGLQYTIISDELKENKSTPPTPCENPAGVYNHNYQTIKSHKIMKFEELMNVKLKLKQMKLRDQN